MGVRQVSCARNLQTNVWWATSDDIPGLVSEATSFEGLVQRVIALIPGLLEENGLPVSGTTIHFLVGSARQRSFAM